MRLGFAGTGWIGVHRLRAVAETGLAEVAAICDPNDDAAALALQAAPGAERAYRFEDLFDRDLDGLVIATPNALHAPQAIVALERGIAVFCQKPLARTAAETRKVIEAARGADRLLGVDLSYRYTEGMCRIRELVRSNALGRVHAVELVFHNAYGPDKSWFFDAAASGGGCVLDLGIHLIDLLDWLVQAPVIGLHSRLYAKGELLSPNTGRVEDEAVVLLELDGGATASLRCSWHAHAGRDAVIGVLVRGSEGGASWHNVDGSFYDFAAERYRGTTRETLASPPDDWGGRAAIAWLNALAAGGRYDSAVESLLGVAAVLDRIYGRDVS